LRQVERLCRRRRRTAGPAATRRVSQSLSFNYQRKLFPLQETAVTRALAGQRVTVFELDDGTIQMRHAGKVLPMTQFGREGANIIQGAVVANKMLARIPSRTYSRCTLG